jgi:spore coat-associated protein N
MESTGIKPASRRARARRVKALKSRRRLLMGGALIAMLIIASAFLVGSGAIFTSTSVNAQNIFTAGILTHGNDKAPNAILTAGPMKPGDVASGQVTISNTGNLDGVFTLAMATKTDTTIAGHDGHLLDALQLKIVDNLGNEYYNGDLNAFASGTSVGTIAAHDALTYTFTVTFPDSGTDSDNQYQGSVAEVDFTWTATETAS